METYEESRHAADVEGAGIDKLEKKESKQRLLEALNRLPMKQKELLVLSRFEGLKYEEIGQIKGITVGAIKVRVHRAIARLREVYFETSENG